MIRHPLTNTTLEQYRLLPGRRRTLQLLLGMPLVFAVASIAGCAETKPAGSPRSKSHITGHGGPSDKGREVGGGQ